MVPGAPNKTNRRRVPLAAYPPVLRIDPTDATTRQCLTLADRHWRTSRQYRAARRAIDPRHTSRLRPIVAPRVTTPARPRFIPDTQKEPAMPTPPPAGPVPIPYPNLASPKGQSSPNWNTSKAVKRVKLQTDDGVSAAQASRFTASSGDTAGTLKGVTAHKLPAPSFITPSPSVKVEGKNAVRHLDMTLNKF